MKIAIAGTGYVGLVSGACFAEMGIEVACIDIDREKVERLREGIIPIYEPGLEEIVTRNLASGRLTFHTSLAEGIGSSLATNTPKATSTVPATGTSKSTSTTPVTTPAEVVFIAVGTPPDEDGSADLSHVLEVAREIGRTMTSPTIVVTKSTVPVGTSDRVRDAVAGSLSERGANIEFDVASNPEFLKEGNAVEDFMHPDRVVVGVASEQARKVMDRLYKPFMVNSYRVIFTDIRSAEMIKYAANAMLATRISFINDIANLCELVGADVNMVRQGIGTDPRIGSKFLYPGLGYGGSCFPKDIKALIHTAEENDYRLEILEAVESVNRRQKEVLGKKVRQVFGDDLSGKVFAVWGLAFKPETDDVRSSAALTVIDTILKLGGTVRVYDPAALDAARAILGDKVTYCTTMYEATEGADALLLVTEWKEFRMPDWESIAKAMRGKEIFDGRNILDRNEISEQGFNYHGIGIL